jgi:putative flippase GtrA
MVRFLHRLLLVKTDNTLIQFFRYGIVGAVTFFIDMGILYSLTLSPVFVRYYILAVTISSGTALLCTYVLSVLWVFKKRNMTNLRFEFIIFCVIGIVGLLLNYLLVWFLTEVLLKSVFVVDVKRIRILIAKPVTTVIVFFWNFFLRKLILFGGKPRSA